MERYENYNFKCARCKDHGTRYLPSGATFTTCGTCGQLCKITTNLNITSNNNNNNNQNTNFRSPPNNNRNIPLDYDGFDEFRNHDDNSFYEEDDYDLIDATPDMYDFNNYSSHHDFMQNHNNEYRREQFQGFMRDNNNRNNNNRNDNNRNNNNRNNNNQRGRKNNNRDIDDTNNPNRGMFSISIANDNYDRYSALRHRSQLNRNDLISDEELWEAELEAEMRNDLNRASYLMGPSINNNSNNRREEPLSIYSQLLLNCLPKEKLKPKLKKEKMTKKLWSKNDSGKFEAPTCCICLSVMKLNEEVTKLKCKHIFHIKCLEKWLENKEECPFCRGKLEDNGLGKIKK